MNEEELLKEYRKLQAIRKRPDWMDYVFWFYPMKHELHKAQYLSLQQKLGEALVDVRVVVRLILDSGLDEYEMNDVINILHRRGSVSKKDNPHLVPLFDALRNRSDLPLSLERLLDWYLEVHGY